MRILLLAPHPFFSLRGTPIAERMLLEAVTAEGHRLDVLTYHEGEDPDISGVLVHRIPNLPGVRDVPVGFSWKKLMCDAFLALKAIRMVRRHDYDLVHAVEEAAFIAMVIKRWRNIPFVYDMDSDLLDQTVDQFPPARAVRRILERAERSLIRESHGVLTVCRLLEERTREKVPDARVYRVEDASLLEGLEGNADDLRSTIGSEGPIVLYVGNLQPIQGIDLLLEAFTTVAQQRSDTRLVVIGGSPERVRGYREKADELGIERSVHFVGPRPLEELGGYLRQATVLVSPRRGGINTPMKIYSYLDSGRPLVATRLPTHTQVLDEDVSRLVDPTPAALADGLLDLLSDPTLRKELGAAARELVQHEFTPEAFRRKMVEVYRQIEESHPSKGPTSDEVASGSTSALAP